MDIAAGVALVEAGGGFVRDLSDSSFTFNKETVLVSGLLAGGPNLQKQLASLIQSNLKTQASCVSLLAGAEEQPT